MPLSIAGRWLAVDAHRVLEIVGPSAITRIPGTPRAILGVAPFRGRAVPVLDVGAVVGAAEPQPLDAPRARTVVVQIGQSTVALPADAVREVIDVPESELAPARPDQPWAEAQVAIHGELAPVLDVARALPAITPV